MKIHFGRRGANALLLTAILLASGGWIVVVRVGNAPLIAAISIILLCGFLGSTRFPRSISGMFVILLGIVFISSYAQDLSVDDKEFFVILKGLIAMIACIHFKRSRLDFRELFVDVMYYTALISLVLYPIAYVAPGIARHIDGEYSTVFGLLYVRATDIERFAHYRNQGFFWEAGVYGVMLTLAYIYNVLMFRRRRGIVFLLAAITTQSMGALSILLPLACYLYIYSRQPKVAKLLATLVVVFVVAAISLPSFIGDAFTVLFGRNVNDDASILVRINDLTLGLRAASDSLWLGRPSGDMDAYNALALDEFGYVKIEDSGISNSLTWLVYKYGIPVGLIYCAVLWRRVRRDFGSVAPIVFAAWCGLLMIEPLGVSIFMFMLLAYRDRPAPIDVSFTNEPTVVKREGDMSPALPSV
ncbi:O-antigen ligase family protein [Paraburkholderia caribensis]|uniref:O-antigen ligase family protein n=1 Tax=Paraburkholderia caribensis TaxID=75105 RepID=A0A9Q6WNU8_9BURK|nr:O-antigen ligase family protein [Paraburkholderia caribensis]MCO4876925.1 hypothetical protein [Paraburkholderia caribensis]PTB30723.1 hypothetical protein C9I56_00495 [Paraburkholderia caribensis]QLB65625.1 hypothetical protein A9O66_24995 [Paraburkholderia caribensis]